MKDIKFIISWLLVVASGAAIHFTGEYGLGIYILLLVIWFTSKE